MTSPWPSDGPGGRRTKAPAARSIVPTDWLSGWLVFAAVASVVLAVVGLVIWPAAAYGLEVVHELTDLLDRAAK